MTFDPAFLVGLPARVDRQMLTRRDTMLYALSVGAGHSEDELHFVYEDHLQALPTMAVTLAYPGFWCKDPQFGIDWRRIVHAGQAVTFHAPLPVEGAVRGEMTIDAITDKGAGKGALIQSTQKIFDDDSGQLLATMMQVSMSRGDGGHGSFGEVMPTPIRIPPGRAPDAVAELKTSRDQAMIYRLTGDTNPVHADPEVAREVGFPGPILHGLCTYGFTGRALLKELCAGDPTRMRQLDCRFTGPVFPGDTITLSIWKLDAGSACFQASVSERNVIVLNHGYVEFDS